MKLETVYVDDLIIRDRLRPLHETAVVALMESIGRIGGVRTPIAIRWEKDNEGDAVPILVAGRHRVEACKRLSIDSLEAVVVQDEVEARLWEISENLHRAELTVQERADHIAEWVRLTERKIQSAQNAPIGSKRADGGGHRPESGINAAARGLGIERTDAQRAIKIASIPKVARDAAEAAGLNTQTARLKIARASDPLAKVRDLVERKSRPAPAIKNADESEEDWRRALFSVWNRGAQDWRERALAAMGTPAFENARTGAARH